MFSRGFGHRVALVGGLGVGLFAASPGLTRAADFIRGDANGDGEVTIADQQAILGYLFRFGEPTACMDALDANDDGVIEITDAALVGAYVLGVNDGPASPFPTAGPDLTEEDNSRNPHPLECTAYGGGTILHDATTAIEVIGGGVDAEEAGKAYLLIATTSSYPLDAAHVRLRFPPGLVAGFEPGDAVSLISDVTISGALAGDSLSLVFAVGPTGFSFIPSGDSKLIGEVPICLAAGTAAGDHPVEIEAAELVRNGFSQAIRPSLASGSLHVPAAVSAAPACAGPPPPPPPPPINAEYILEDTSGIPGGAVDVTFQMVADASIQGYAYSIDFDEEVIEALSTDVLWQKPDGSRYSFVVNEINNLNATPGNGGVDEGFLIGTAVFEFHQFVGLPPGEVTDVLRFHLRIRPETTATSTRLTFIDGGQGRGTPVPNKVAANGDQEYTRDSPGSFVFTGGLLGIGPDISIFLRADSNGDGAIDISDPQATLGMLFLGGSAVACFDAADANDDGRMDVSDAIFTLAHLFLGGSTPPAPFPEAGKDPTADSMGCSYR